MTFPSLVGELADPQTLLLVAGVVLFILWAYRSLQS